MKVSTVFHTDGHGLWSRVSKEVGITKLMCEFYDEDQGEEYGELRVYFSKKTWNIEKFGLIYTDKLFLKELKLFLFSLGLVGNDVEYSEMGMQSENYVSLDCGRFFVRSWKAFKGKSNG